VLHLIYIIKSLYKEDIFVILHKIQEY